MPADDLAAAVPWHRTDLATLGIPSWRFVRTLLTGYEQVDGWLVAGGADELREKTRQLFADGPRPWPRPSRWSASWASARTWPNAG
nr:hypothetical protein GCM10020093_060470 [Planobispora longispora]